MILWKAIPEPMVPQLAPASSSLSPAPAAVVHYPGLSQLAHPVPSETDATASRADDSKAKEATQPSAAPDALVVLIDSASLMEEVLSKFQDFVDETQSLLVVLRSARSHEPGSPRSTKNDDVPTEGKQEREGEILGPESEEGFRQRLGDDERDFEDGEHDRGDTGSSSEDGATQSNEISHGAEEHSRPAYGQDELDRYGATQLHKTVAPRVEIEVHQVGGDEPNEEDETKSVDEPEELEYDEKWQASPGILPPTPTSLSVSDSLLGQTTTPSLFQRWAKTSWKSDQSVASDYETARESVNGSTSEYYSADGCDGDEDFGQKWYTHCKWCDKDCLAPGPDV